MSEGSGKKNTQRAAQVAPHNGEENMKINVPKLARTFYNIIDENLNYSVMSAARGGAWNYIIAQESLEKEPLVGDCLWAMAIGTLKASKNGESVISEKALKRLEGAVMLFNDCPDLLVFKAE